MFFILLQKCSCSQFSRFFGLCSSDYYYNISVFCFKVIFWVFSFDDYFFVLGVMLGRHLVSNMNLGPEANPAEHLWFKAHFAGHVKDQRDIPLGSLKWLCLWREREMQRESEQEMVCLQTDHILPPTCGERSEMRGCQVPELHTLDRGHWAAARLERRRGCGLSIQ